jgi:serine/threonine protein kinase
LKREVEILREGHPNLPKLIAANEAEKWMVTEYFPNRSLDKSPTRFKGEAVLALKAIRPLVQTVGILHEKRTVHRDIKPHNVFVANDGRLVLGDFGIAFRDTGEPRATVTQETVGPGDYMPPWGEGGRLDEVKPSFDIYMLGKLLWCMISGRLKLQREWHRKPENDLAAQFPDDRIMPVVNSILDSCIVPDEDHCIPSASDLLKRIDEALSLHGAGLSVDARGNLIVPCVVCGRGVYKEEAPDGGTVELIRISRMRERLSPIIVRSFRCNVCTHAAFFGPTYPDAAKGRGWKPL